MKKMFMMCCAVAAAVCAQGATVKTVRGLAAGDVGEMPFGKIVAAEVVSEVADGTVALSRVTEVDVFTNAYSVTVSTARVMEVSSVATLDVQGRQDSVHRHGDRRPPAAGCGVI